MAAQQPGPSPRRQSAGTTIARPVALDAFRLARRTFQAGDRVDMQTLARTLHVDRVTVYRWVGSREQLLTEILWSLIEPTIVNLREAYDGRVDALRNQSLDRLFRRCARNYFGADDCTIFFCELPGYCRGHPGPRGHH